MRGIGCEEGICIWIAIVIGSGDGLVVRVSVGGWDCVGLLQVITMFVLVEE